MSLLFGLYISAIGIAIVFAALLIIVAISMTTCRIFPIEKLVGRKKELMKVAAIITATQSLLEKEMIRPPKQEISDTPRNWSTAARLEALSKRVDDK